MSVKNEVRPLGKHAAVCKTGKGHASATGFLAFQSIKPMAYSKDVAHVQLVVPAGEARWRGLAERTSERALLGVHVICFQSFSLSPTPGLAY